MKNIKLDKLVKDYIINAIDLCDYDLEGQKVKTDAQKIAFVYNVFKREKGYDIDRVGEHQAFINWIMGLPTCFNIDFENYKILQLAKLWGSIPENATERQEDKILANWWNFITIKFFQLVKKYKKGV